MNNDTVQVKN